MSRLSVLSCAGLVVGGLLLAASAATAGEGDKMKSDPKAAPTTQPAKGDAKHPRVLLETSMGNILIELDAEKAPITVENFLKYVDDGFYDGTVFHRVVPTFMIQGGGFTPDGKEKATRPPIKNEWANGLKNKRGTIAMARTAAPDSATAQFFINVKDNLFLSEPRGGAGYAVFGEVVEGMDVVDRIKGVDATMNEMGEKAKPVKPVIINKAKRQDAK